MRTIASIVALVLASLAGTYTVQRGETLGGIASRHRVPVAALAKANRISDPDRIYAGQVLTIPGRARAAAPKPAAAAAKHVIRSGETLGAIAKRYRVSVAALAKANGIENANLIRAGQVLTVRAGATWVCPVAAPTAFINDYGAARGGGRSHEGTDLLAPRGTPVVASTSGVLVRHDQPRGGLAFYLRGDDGLTYYGAHLATFVRADGRVRIGETIGTVGDTGNARGGPTHLHFEIINSKGPKNPFTQLMQHCPRRSA